MHGHMVHAVNVPQPFMMPMCLMVTPHLMHVVLQTDVGSLNGTLLNGVLISNEYRQPGKPHALTEGDVVEFGGSTRVLVSCFPSPPPQPRGVSLGGAATASPGSAAATAAVVPSSASEPGRNGGGAHSESSDRRRFRSASLQV